MCLKVLEVPACAGGPTGCAARGPLPGGGSPATLLPASPGGRHRMPGRSLIAQPPLQFRGHPLLPQERQLRPLIPGIQNGRSRGRCPRPFPKCGKMQLRQSSLVAPQGREMSGVALVGGAMRGLACPGRET